RRLGGLTWRRPPVSPGVLMHAQRPLVFPEELGMLLRNLARLCVPCAREVTMSADRGSVSRRTLLGGAATAGVAAAASQLFTARPAFADGAVSLAASPPTGFVPLAAPGK